MTSNDRRAVALWLLICAALGITTLLLGVPVALGAAHQGGAVVLLAAALWNAHASHRQPEPAHASAA